MGFGAARGARFGEPWITPRMTSNAAMEAAAPTAANLIVFELPCQLRWLPVVEPPLDIASAPLDGALSGVETPAAAAWPREPAADK